jgi:acyl-CoA hydrolase
LACDEALCDSESISWRSPYHSSPALRKLVNEEKLDFVDMHLSNVPKTLISGSIGEIDVAIIEATEITSDGKVYLTTGIGSSPTFLQKSKHVIIELNSYHSPDLSQMSDIFITSKEPIPITRPLDKIGVPYAKVDPKKVLGIVHTNIPDTHPGPAFTSPGKICYQIGENVTQFLFDKTLVNGRILIQSGVGNVCNATLYSIANSNGFPHFQVYTEVLQDAMLDLIESGSITGASTCSLTLSDNKLQAMYKNMDYYINKIILRPQEISNSPEVIRRLGIISINTAIEADIYGNVNSTHFFGTQLMNGIGGSGDFARNSFLSIFICPSIAKDGKISTIVPMCTHVDHSEHSVQVIITEQGVADLRGLSPANRAKLIIDNCAHPAYRDYLHNYVKTSSRGHIRHNLRNCFELHNNYLNFGTMGGF